MGLLHGTTGSARSAAAGPFAIFAEAQARSLHAHAWECPVPGFDLPVRHVYLHLLRRANTGGCTKQACGFR